MGFFNNINNIKTIDLFKYAESGRKWFPEVNTPYRIFLNGQEFDIICKETTEGVYPCQGCAIWKLNKCYCIGCLAAQRKFLDNKDVYFEKL